MNGRMKLAKTYKPYTEHTKCHIISVMNGWLKCEMHPTSRPARPLSWSTRQQVLQNIQTWQRSLNHLQSFQRFRMDWPHVNRPASILLTPKDIQELIRLESALVRAPAMATLPPAWHRQPSVTTPSPYQEYGGGQLGPSEWRAWGPWAAWGNLASGWVVGAMLLLGSLLLVRYIDRCIARRKFLNLRRRQSEEWPTPTVLATSHQFPILDADIESLPRLSDFDAPPSETSGNLLNCDLPPPYSECTEPPLPRAAGSKQTITEELPPPYSACYVAFSNPKDGVPSVHIYNEQGQSLPSDSHSSSFNEHAEVLEGSVEIVNNIPNNGCERNSTDNSETNENSNNVGDTNVLNRAIASTSNANDRVESSSHIIDIDIINTLPGEVLKVE
ncbi:unnamed protein product [Parnassius mnemosyne]|uniref:Uncharacterized protein n=1 Tax=Parnassius mnemosyne TaxID=213953 RepID=A0AAV1L3L9_9NEOP